MMFLTQFTTTDENATSVVLDAIRSLCLWICRFVYKLIAFFYELFMNMTQIEILQQPEIEKLYKRVTILLGLIMLFVSIFFLLKMLLNPDKINDKEQGMGSLIKRIITVILMLGFVPSIFTMANELQKKVITSDIIPKVLLGKTFMAGGDTSNIDSFSKNYGRRLSANLFKTFYYKNEDIISEKDDCIAYDFIEQEMAQYGTIETAVSCVNNKGTAKDQQGGANVTAYTIEYESLGSVFVGIAVLWMIIVYTINVGVRIIQFTFLQIIAPIPIISYVYPQKDGMFQKWVRQSITTYLDLFIRLGVIYFVFYLTDLIFNSAVLSGFNENNVRWLQIILILALLVFAKRLPKLLQEMAGKPNAASLGFGVSGSNGAAGVLMGAATAGAMGFLGSTGAARFTGLAKGLVKGGMAGATGGNYAQNMRPVKDGIIRSNQADEWLKAQGYHGLSRYYQRAVIGSGGITKAERYEYQAQADANLKKQVDDTDTVQTYSSLQNQWKSYSGDITRFGEAYSVLDFETDANGNTVPLYRRNQDGTYMHDDRGNRIQSSHSEYRLRDYEGNVIWDTGNKKQGYDPQGLKVALDDGKKEARNKALHDPKEKGIQAAKAEVIRRSRRTPGRTDYLWKDLTWDLFNPARKETLSNSTKVQRPHGARGPH